MENVGTERGGGGAGKGAQGGGTGRGEEDRGKRGMRKEGKGQGEGNPGERSLLCRQVLSLAVNLWMVCRRCASAELHARSHANIPLRSNTVVDDKPCLKLTGLLALGNATTAAANPKMTITQLSVDFGRKTKRWLGLGHAVTNREHNPNYLRVHVNVQLAILHQMTLQPDCSCGPAKTQAQEETLPGDIQQAAALLYFAVMAYMTVRHNLCVTYMIGTPAAKSAAP